MVLTYFHIWSSKQENLSLGPEVRTAKALTHAGRSAPLLFAYWKAIISELASSEILIFKLVSVAEQAGLNLTVRNLEDRACRIEAHKFSIIIYNYS